MDTRPNAVLLVAFATAAVVAAEGSERALLSWPPWPWSNHTTPPPSPNAILNFPVGFADALGFQDVKACLGGFNSSLHDIEHVVADYRQGGMIGKAKAMEKILVLSKDMLQGFSSCMKTDADLDRLRIVIANLADQRFYTLQNAATLLLNIGEDRGDFEEVASQWKNGLYKESGASLAVAIMHVLGDAGFPHSNGTAIVRVARGIVQGFIGVFDTPCFDSAKVDIQQITNSLKYLLEANVPRGVLGLLKAVAELVPTFEDCKKDAPKIENIIKELKALVHPAQLAAVVDSWDSISSKADFFLEAASGVLAFHGKEWTRFGEEVGKLVGQILVPPPKATLIV